MNTTTRTNEIDWVNTIFLCATPILGIILTIYFFKNTDKYLGQIILGIVFYIATGLSITAGYHRLFSHRTYKANPLLKLIYLLFGAAAFQNSALKWSTDHRVHHNHVDGDQDPYNINKGFFYAHIGWIFFKENAHANSIENFPKDLVNDKLLMWQHRHYIPLAVLMGFVLPTLLGYFLGSAIGGLAIAGLVRIVFVHHCTFFINSLCHIVGTRPYTDSNTARDSFIMAFFSYGEGYHNYHHFFPSDYRNGVKWYQFDPTKWLILTASVFGLARDLKKVPERIITEAKSRMLAKTNFA
jgi:stearoyl-CoA desaturase (delta-9 desaturase)